MSDIKKTKGNWKLKAEAVDRTVDWTNCGGDRGPIVKQTTEW
jgi:hypothetical protein